MNELQFIEETNNNEGSITTEEKEEERSIVVIDNDTTEEIEKERSIVVTYNGTTLIQEPTNIDNIEELDAANTTFEGNCNQIPSTPITNNDTKDSIDKHWKKKEGIFNTTHETC